MINLASKYTSNSKVYIKATLFQISQSLCKKQIRKLVFGKVLMALIIRSMTFEKKMRKYLSKISLSHFIDKMLSNGLIYFFDTY